VKSFTFTTYEEATRAGIGAKLTVKVFDVICEIKGTGAGDTADCEVDIRVRLPSTELKY
jgi:hypothetical protein